VQQAFTDQLGRSVVLQFPPKRIISLVPSQTELLFFLGVSDRLVGVTKFCTHPAEGVKKIAKVGGTKTVWLDVIDQLQPDLIIGNKEENDQSSIQLLAEKYSVWMSDISSYSQALQMIESIGALTQRGDAAAGLIRDINLAFQELAKPSPKRVLYLIWKSPWMAAGKDTFIDSMITKAGWQNGVTLERYPTLSDQQIQSINPEVVFLSSEPFPFADKHCRELQQLLPHAKIQLVDGELFSWYGNRMVLAPAYFNSLSL